MVEVFKTNITNTEDAQRILSILQNSFPHYKVNFDLEDCDKILRVKSPDHNLRPERIVNTLHQQGFEAAILP